MHDDAWRTEAGRDHDDFVHARLLPHTAKDAGRIPHTHETLDLIHIHSSHLLLSFLLRFNSLFPDKARINLYHFWQLAPPRR